jgi:hypothetical protein
MHRRSGFPASFLEDWTCSALLEEVKRLHGTEGMMTQAEVSAWPSVCHLPLSTLTQHIFCHNVRLTTCLRTISSLLVHHIGFSKTNPSILEIYNLQRIGCTAWPLSLSTLSRNVRVFCPLIHRRLLSSGAPGA